MTDAVSLAEAAGRVGVTALTLRRWAEGGLVPGATNGGWIPAAVAQARVVARLRERGHTLAEIRAATDEGRLAFGQVEDLLGNPGATRTLAAAARATGLEPALIQRILLSMGFSAPALDRISDDDLQLLRYVAAVLGAGLPLVALLQLVRVYGQALAQMADAEVRLFHLYVHEPLMRDGVPGLSGVPRVRSSTGPSASNNSCRGARVRASACTTARRSTATGATTGARSTWPRGWRREPPAGRSS